MKQAIKDPEGIENILRGIEIAVEIAEYKKVMLKQVIAEHELWLFETKEKVDSERSQYCLQKRFFDAGYDFYKKILMDRVERGELSHDFRRVLR